MSEESTVAVQSRHRVAAIVALLALLATVAWLLVAVLARWPALLASIALVSMVIVAAWYVVSRRGVTRIVSGVLGAAALAGFVAVMVTSQSVRILVVALLLAAISITAAGYALRRDRGVVPLPPAASARRPVLVMNPRSGGGKVERFGLVDHCLRAGIEPIVLAPGDDLLELAEAAVAGGADVIGMAGGDGSQALVASVASRHGIPFVVVPAGTRNHFALDLGIDREDVAAALDAYRDGIDRRIDLAEVNGRVFVNNAAMGLYATIVQSADYRDAKMATTAEMLPDLLGPTATPSDLIYTLPSGADQVAGQLLLVSNNPYQLHQLRGGGRRARLDAGVLGAASLTVSTAADVEALTALELTGRIDRFRGWQEWTAKEIEVRSPRPVEIGVDGEALVLEPPLRFSCRPQALTVRLSRAAVTRAAVSAPVRVTESTTVAALWRLALGRGEAR